MMSSSTNDAAQSSEPQADPPAALEATTVGALPAPAPEPKALGFDTNVRLSFLFLGVVGLVALSAWGAARGACNYNPSTSQKFVEAPLERRVERPKNAALEFQHRLFIQDFDAASELALEGGIDIVEDAKDACDEDCASQRSSRADRARTLAILHQVRGMSAWVTVETHFEGQVFSDTYELERVSRQWLVIGYSEPPS